MFPRHVAVCVCVCVCVLEREKREREGEHGSFDNYTSKNEM